MRTITPLANRDVVFARDGEDIVRTTKSGGVVAYIHRCDADTFEKVAWVIEETPASGRGTDLRSIVEAERIPFTRVDVAIAFLKERGIIDVRHRRLYAGTSMPHLDAMVEFHALGEEATPCDS